MYSAPAASSLVTLALTFMESSMILASLLTIGGIGPAACLAEGVLRARVKEAGYCTLEPFLGNRRRWASGRRVWLIRCLRGIPRSPPVLLLPPPLDATRLCIECEDIFTCHPVLAF